MRTTEEALYFKSRRSGNKVNLMTRPQKSSNKNALHLPIASTSVVISGYGGSLVLLLFVGPHGGGSWFALAGLLLYMLASAFMIKSAYSLLRKKHRAMALLCLVTPLAVYLLVQLALPGRLYG